MDVKSVNAPQAMLCWSRATRIMQMFVVGEKYLTVNLTTAISLGLRNKLVEAEPCVPVNDKPTAPHPVSPKLFSTLCFKADHIAFPSIGFALPTVYFPSCAIPCTMGMNSTRIQRFWPLPNFRDRMYDVHGLLTLNRTITRRFSAKNFHQYYDIAQIPTTKTFEQFVT
jgi:hypothetical protein